MSQVEVEDGRPFGFTFAAGFLLFFGSAVLYLAYINSNSMTALIESFYGILGIVMAAAGLFCAAKAASSAMAASRRVAPTKAKSAESSSAATVDKV